MILIGLNGRVIPNNKSISANFAKMPSFFKGIKKSNIPRFGKAKPPSLSPKIKKSLDAGMNVVGKPRGTFKTRQAARLAYSSQKRSDQLRNSFRSRLFANKYRG